VEEVLQPVKQLRRKMGQAGSSRKQTLEEVGVLGVSKEVKNMPSDDVTAEIERICLDAVGSILRGEGFSYLMPSRVASNQMYVPELDRVVLKDKMLERVFARTGQMIETFEATYGAPYPWPRYDQVIVHDFIFGGMENAGATTLTDLCLADASASLVHDPDDLIAHELAHQWFGNLVTMEWCVLGERDMPEIPSSQTLCGRIEG